MKKAGLSHKERIKRKKDFELLYSHGTQLFSLSQKLKAIYIFAKNHGECNVKVAFAVHKKAGNSVWRNRVRRLLRESYRLNKDILISHFSGQGQNLQIIFSLNKINQRDNRKIFLKDLMPEVIDLMEQIKKRI